MIYIYAVPSPRCFHTAAVVGNRLLVFGGARLARDTWYIYIHIHICHIYTRIRIYTSTTSVVHLYTRTCIQQRELDTNTTRVLIPD